MNRSDDVAKVREIRSLMERIQQLPPNLGTSAAQQLVTNPYFQQWSNYQAAMLAAGRAPGRGGTGINPWLLVLATGLNTVVAAVLAVLITLSVVRQDPARELERAAALGPAAEKGPAAAPRAALIAPDPSRPAAPPRPVAIEQIGAPDRPLRLEALKAAPLPLRITPPEAAAETFILVLAGLPANVTLSGASRIGADSWLLPPNAAGKLQITIPEWSSTPIEVEIELRRTDGAVAARGKAWLAVPPPAMAQARTDKASLPELLQRGDQLLGRGDIVAARVVYERAAELGSAPAAFALASTYDPSRLWSLGVFGMVGNKERARQWYKRAEELGHPQAKDRLQALAE